MLKAFITFLLVFILTESFCQTKFQKDFEYYWKTIHDNYAYFDKQKTDWAKVKSIYQGAVDSCHSDTDFLHLLEAINNEFYNGHIFLNRNTKSSNRTIPTGADLKIRYLNNKFIIDEARPGFNSDLCGLKKGMQVIAYNDQEIGQAIKNFLPKSVSSYDSKMYEYAATMFLAGTHNSKRKITALIGSIQKDFFPDTIPNKAESNYATVLDSRLLNNNIGYIKINNSLGNSELIKQFDEALDALSKTSGLILDLRETPSGGNTNIARAIMGRFTSRELAYQKHIYTSEEKETGIKRVTLELVSPRQKIYNKPFVVLVGYWTGSMGEGIAIGFDRMKNATIAGTKMAGLLGEIYSFETPEMKIPFSFPCVQLQTVNGQPREDFVPPVLMNDQEEALKLAVKILIGKKN